MLSKIMGLFNTRGADKVTGNQNQLTKIATAMFEVRGSVHDDGNVNITVKNQYGDVNHNPIDVRASVHDGGNIHIDVQNEHDWDDGLPQPANSEIADGKVGKTLEKRGDVHSPGTCEYEIDELVMVPIGGEGKHTWQKHGDRTYFKALADEGYDCWDKVEVTGSVHDYGRVDLTIDTVYVYTPEKYKTVGDLI